ncbi:Pectinesterase inhibitor domain [Dillenia turbinata]|uniref:Pectinesterase inhibitor domain n=1 Tax=Dillenia turbinata TaxID=194707 RepID=A0AAN8YWN1_9MAGN
MSSNPYTLSFLFFFFVFFISPSLASFFNLHDSRHNLQFYTLPSFCKSLFPNNASANIHDYGRFPLSQSLKSATKFHSLVNWYLRFKFIYPTQVVNALQDCQLLAELNIDFLSNTAKSTDPTDTLYGVEAQDSHTLLSAILKNQETCSYGLELASATAASIKNALLVPFQQITPTLAFLIHVVGGVYEENVFIAKSKINLLIIGDGSNQTVIAGKSGVVEGWTTYNSNTLDKLSI